MKFRTEIKIPKEKNTIDYHSNIVLFGSCFTENLERHFNYFKFKNLSNPYGILFHPKAIEKAIFQCINHKEYKQQDLYFNDDHWLSLDHHTKFSSSDPEKILDQINTKISEAQKALTHASHIMITLGTSWVYRYIKTNELVGNCHKIPQKNFQKELLSIDQIKESLMRIKFLIKEINPESTIIFTVSPVRHIRDGSIENTQSKAHLHTAIQQITNQQQVFYFPSYEIMMDDLRDYRFYKNDMLHPNETAMEYIWEKFKDVWISEDCCSLMKEVDGIQKSLLHRPFREESEKHREFLHHLKTKIEKLTKRHPHIRFN